MLITLSMWPRRRRPNTTGSRTAPKPFISDAQWNLIKDLFENPDPSPKGGRPRIDARACLEGIFWILKNGGRWEDLPDRILTFDMLATAQRMDGSRVDR
ncbi:MAG: transposase [Planctomycetaceae bacterium]